MKQHWRYKLIGFGAMVVFLTGGIVAWLAWQEQRSVLTIDSDCAYLYIYPGMTLDSVCAQLETAHFSANAQPFARYMRRKKYDSRIKVGRYRLTNGLDNRTFAQHLVFGMQEPVNLRLNNMRLPQDVAAKVSRQLLLDSATIMHCLTDADYLSKYGLKPETAVALFVPNTYEVYWNVSIDDFFDRMWREYNHFWNENRRKKAQAIGLTPVEVATLASIVDEETNIKADKHIIAGLYLNRLRKRMPLQACPTAKFAVGDFTLTRVLKEHTQIDSPYNTYKHAGLPPGPIRVASIDGIDAVLNYKPSNYLYMCASDRLDGTHNFAASLTEHNRNRQRYIRAYREWEKTRKKQ